MQIIEIAALSNGAHRNQTWHGPTEAIPEGYLAIPDDIEVPESYPFVDITVKKGKITKLTAREVPEPEPTPAPEPTETERLRADVDFLLAMGGYVE